MRKNIGNMGVWHLRLIRILSELNKEVLTLLCNIKSVFLSQAGTHAHTVT